MSEIKPFDFQIKVAELLLAGKSVVLQAPTGAGKTAAALLPFIHTQQSDTSVDFPSKCIYVVPMRVLANQFVRSFNNLTQSYARKFRRDVRATIQTGEHPDDPRFEQGHVVFCTVDQFLSSYLTMPFSLSQRQANLNAGAMVGAYLVFDEFHLFDPQTTLPSVLYSLKQLRPLAPCLLMTATFSREMLDALAHELNAEVVLVSQDEARQIETRGNQQPRSRVWQVGDKPLSAATVLAHHASRSIAICNTVRRAQQLYRDLKDEVRKSELNIELLLLHSRFLQQDRSRIEDRLIELFGKERDRGGSAILVATQAIEVGIDITCETLHTELGPASALIQRAGRCARFLGERGEVIVYPVTDYAPYGKAKEEPGEESPWVEEMRQAFKWLGDNSPIALSFDGEQELINTVAAPRDQRILENLAAGRQIHADTIERVLMGDRQGNDARVLVRDVDSRWVLVHSDPNVLLKNPLAAEGLNVPTRTLYGMVKDWLERATDAEWRVRILAEDDLGDAENERRVEYGWKPLAQPSLLWTTRALVVHPDLAGYWHDEGFVSERGGSGFESTLPELWTTSQREAIKYRLEPYEDHVRRVVECFKINVLPEIGYAAQSLERAANWQSGSVLCAAWLACLFHDVGKLSKGWQAWAHSFQKEIAATVKSDFAIAHTDFDDQNPAHLAAERTIHARYPKPPHAGASARATAMIIKHALADNEPLLRATLTAISRHHTPFADRWQPYELVTDAEAHIRATLGCIPKEVTHNIDLKLLKRGIRGDQEMLLVLPSDTCGWLAYLVLARALRRADQAGTATGSREG